MTWIGPATTGTSHHHGGVILSSKILVAYATRAGSTAEVAKTVGQVLSNLGARVDVLAVADVTDLSAYRAVVLGSAVRFGQWLPEALKFLEHNSAALRDVPVAFFSLHTLSLGSDDSSRAARMAYTAPACKIVSPRVEAFFAGNGDPSRLPFFLRLLVKLTKSPEADLRDWVTIRGWAESLSGVL